jgi:hypothetical protein
MEGCARMGNTRTRARARAHMHAGPNKGDFLRPCADWYAYKREGELNARCRGWVEVVGGGGGG